VNTGAVEWPSVDSAYFTVRRMQTKLHRWAGDDASRRFGDLFNLVYDPAFLMHAWERVSTNTGARTAGIDQVTATWIESRIGVGEFLGQVRNSLKSGEFTPVEVRQVMIPKGTSGKFRKLGIPTIADRVVQASLKAVLEPIFEADFKPCSYGFRPNRRAHDAIAEIHYLGTRGYEWVLEADIAACFDEISHTAVMDRLRARIKDKRVCALVKAFLKSGVFTELGRQEETLTGTPQGGILSPLLANIALSALDEYFDQHWHEHMGTPEQRSARRRGPGWRRSFTTAVITSLCRRQGATVVADWRAWTDAVVDDIGTREAAVIVGHSGAGPLLPVIASKVVPPPSQLVFVDAGLPPVSGDAHPCS
jgi:RNA-directed DNA polymerase